LQVEDTQPVLEDPARAATNAWPATAIAALAVALAVGALYLLQLQPRLYGDGPGLVSMVALGGSTYHVAFLPLARAFASTLAGGDAVLAGQLACALPMAAAAGLLVPTFQRLGVSLRAASLGALVWATTPGALFFATTVEVHAPHAAAFALTLFAVTHAPWSRPVLATLLVVPALAALYWTHVSAPLLGLGLVLLVKVSAPRLSWPAVLFGVGPAWLLAFVLAMSLAAAWRGLGFSPFAVDKELSILSDYARTDDVVGVFWHNLVPYLVAAILGVGGLVSGIPARARLAWVALVVPSWIFFTVWGVREFGGYFLPTTTLLAWAVASLRVLSVDRVRTFVVGAAVVSLQLVLGRLEIERWGEGWDYTDRAAIAHQALPDGGTLVVPWVDAPSVELWHDDVVEFPIMQQISRGMLGGLPPESMSVAAQGLAQLLAEGPVAVDLSYRTRAEFHAVGGRLPFFEALEAALDDQYRVERHERGVFAVVRIELP
jgi:hypothetical protein